MNEKTIRIKLVKILVPVARVGPIGMSNATNYRLESMTNTVLIDTGYVNKRRVGDEIGEAEAEYLCADRRTEVLVT